MVPEDNEALVEFVYGLKGISENQALQWLFDNSSLSSGSFASLSYLDGESYSTPDVEYVEYVRYGILKKMTCGLVKMKN